MYYFGIILICIGITIVGAIASYVTKMVLEYKRQKREIEQFKRFLEEKQREQLKNKAGPG